MTVEMVPLGDIATVNPRKKSLDSSQTCSFVPMDAVDDVTGRLAYTLTRQIAEVQQGYTAFAENDVLFAKITPCMENGKAAIARRLVNSVGFGSTEFHVLRASEETLPEWIFYFVRKKSTRELAEQFMTGSAGQRRVPASFLSEVSIPKPDLKVQKVLIERLERADRLRRLRQYALTISDQYLQNLFLEMFGDPETNPKGWDRALLSEVGNLDRGVSKHRPRNDPALLGGAYPLIQTGDISNSNGFIYDFESTYSDLGLKQSRMWPKDTLCITIAANIGKTAILTFPACFPDSVVGFYPQRGLVTTEFVRYWFVQIQKHLEETAPESAQKNINLEILRNLVIPVPEIKKQILFTQVVHKHERLRRMQVEALRQAEQLYETLLEEAFTRQNRLLV